MTTIDPRSHAIALLYVMQKQTPTLCVQELYDFFDERIILDECRGISDEELITQGPVLYNFLREDSRYRQIFYELAQSYKEWLTEIESRPSPLLFIQRNRIRSLLNNVGWVRFAGEPDPEERVEHPSWYSLSELDVDWNIEEFRSQLLNHPPQRHLFHTPSSTRSAISASRNREHSDWARRRSGYDSVSGDQDFTREILSGVYPFVGDDEDESEGDDEDESEGEDDKTNHFRDDSLDTLRMVLTPWFTQSISFQTGA